MGLFDMIVSLFYGIDRNEEVERFIKEKYEGNKYWKNFSFKGIDGIDFSGQTRQSFSKFCSIPKNKDVNCFSLLLEPAVKNIVFDMYAGFPLTKPTVAFLRTDKEYSVGSIKVFEIARIFIKFDNDQARTKTVAEARYVLIDDGKKVTIENVIVNFDEKFTKEKIVAGIFANATFCYMAIQWALKNKPTIYKDTGLGSQREPKDSNENNNSDTNTVLVQRTIIKHPDGGSEETSAHKEMKCSAWGVSGHYRHLKNGKVIWVRPYVKGKERNNPEAYNAKTYQFAKDNGCKK